MIEDLKLVLYKNKYISLFFNTIIHLSKILEYFKYKF